MVQEIHLYLDNKEVFFSEPPEILFTFQRIDYTNPTAIKNSFTKTVTIEGTPENNKVFGEIYLLGRTQNELMYNPSKRVPFQLFSNGDLVETGYAKLDNIIKDGYKIQYEITLYGGLGDFFYGLSYGFDYDDYDSDREQTKDEELKLKDLTYYSPSADDDTEFNFAITKDAVYNAWMVLASDEDPTGDDVKWGYINFAPAYNGIPEDFNAENVLINTSGYTAGNRLAIPQNTTVNNVPYTDQQVISLGGFATGITKEGTTYLPVNGYALGKLREPMTEWEIRDLRSYLQRPVLRLKGFVEAVQRYAREKGGYTLNLDSDFFNADNPYYEKAWITLPMLQNLNGEYSEREYSGATLDIAFASEETKDDGTVSNYHNNRIITKYDIIGFPTGVQYFKGGSITVSFGINAQAANTGTSEPAIKTLNTTYYNRYSDGMNVPQQYLTTYDLQLVAYDVNDNIVNTSKHVMFTTQFIGTNGDNRTFNNTYSRQYRNFPTERDSVYYYGNFKTPTPGTTARNFTWNSDVTQSGVTMSLLDEDTQYTRMELIVTKHNSYSTSFADLMSRDGKNFDPYRTVTTARTTELVNYVFPWTQNNYNIGVLKSSVTIKPNDTKMKSNQLITKSKLLSQEGTPADYLISYCKLFNLYFDKDPIEKVVTIRTRANFYDGNVIDLEDKIDRSKEIKITPIASDNKWYDFNYTQGDYSEFEKRYYDTWGTDFGKQKLKTEYNFDNSSKDLLEGNIFKNGITAQEQSKYYVAKMRNGGVFPSFLYDWAEYQLFSQTANSYEPVSDMYISQTTPHSTSQYTSISGLYDFYPKLQLHTNKNESIDGSNILVFFNGMQKTVADYRIFYNITDDLGEMYSLVDDTCWLYTNITTNLYGIEIAKRITINNDPYLPMFTRYDLSGSTINRTWDFGKCNELFVPETEYGDNYPTINDRYWKQYVSDLYHTTTRVVECYVKLDGKVEGDWLKHFYYFDDSIWCLTKIEDYNITSFDTTKCQFVKVGDMNNYRYWYTN